VLYYLADASSSEITFHARNLIAVNKFAKATVIEKFDTIGEHKSFTTIVNEIKVGENAQFEYFKVENDTENAYHISNVHATQAKSSNFKTFTFSLNGAMVRNNLNIKLEGEGIDTYMNGLYLLKGKTHVDNHTVADHTKPNCHSNELYKGIIDDYAKAVFNGKIFVRQDAQKTNAFQSNKNILLSDNATINTKPQLEIWADDVSCSHGCTIGQLDLDALFYLQTRGIKKDKAKAMLLHAFASDVLETVANQAIKNYLEQIITIRLEK
jgi:Fe-S cluster assembly protein SufD